MKSKSRNLDSKYLNKLKESMFRISHAVHDSDNISILYNKIHKEVASLIHTNNFYIAIFQKENNTISFPYYVDINDCIPKESIELGLGLTSFIIKSSKPCLINKEKYLELTKKKLISKIGTSPESFLGVPLINHLNETVGVLAIQSYTKDISFNKNDLDIMVFIAEQIALALEKFDHIKQIHNNLKFDDLTGLPNKNYFFDIALHQVSNNENLLFVLFDLDDFMLFIDNYGEDVGNKILRKLALRLKNHISDDETLSYWGGDKFNLILKFDSDGKNNFNTYNHQLKTDLMNQYKIEKRIIKLINILKKSIKVDGLEFQVNSSIGVSIFPNDSKNINELIRNSEIAMNYVKNNGKNNFKIYNHQLKTDLMNQYGVEVGLRKAIQNKQWKIYYQPKFDSFNLIYGFEALIRWNHPQRGLISPLEFIPVAERSDQIKEIGKYVIDTVCRQTKKWVDAGHNLIGSINLSVKQLEEGSIVTDLKNSLEYYQLDPKYLELEITESVMIKNEKKNMDTLNKIKDIGLLLSIDDFGTGYSSFNYLNNMPIDTLKIDKSFITDIDKEEEKYKITSSIIKMANDLNVSVVAEGVETKDEFLTLESVKCDKYQGYYFSEPLTLSQFEEIL